MADIGEAADRLIHISQELLELNRLDEGRDMAQEPVDWTEQVEKIGRMLAPLAEEDRITLETDLGEDCIVRCNQEDASQILRNLMENAIKYNVTGGEVLVTTRRQGARVLLSVADTGVGIPEADMPRIFERFYRVDKARSRAAGGTGLGLSIVRDAVRHHGGTITVQARQPAGVVFTVILPAWREEESGDERKMRRGPALGPLPLRAGGLRGKCEGNRIRGVLLQPGRGEEAALVAEKRVLPRTPSRWRGF